MDEKKVLIVEDESQLSSVLKTVIESMNHKALVAKNGFEAEDILKNESVDLILLDLLMPGKDGFEFLRDLRSNDKNKHTRVVILTNYDQDTKKEELLTLGISDYLVKSDSALSSLEETIKKYLI